MVAVQKQALIAGTESTLAWVRVFVVATLALSLAAAGVGLDEAPWLWAVVFVAMVYSASNSVLSLYREYRNLFTGRVFLVADLVVITLLVAASGGYSSNLHILYALPLAVVVCQHGGQAGVYYCLAVSVVYPVSTIALTGRTSTAWAPHVALLWALCLLLWYVTYDLDDREERANRRSELSALYRAASAPLQTEDHPALIEWLLSGALNSADICHASLYRYDSEIAHFDMCYSLSCEKRGDSMEMQSVRVLQTDMLYTVLYRNLPAEIVNLHTDRRMKNSVIADRPMRSAILAPVIFPGGDPFGVLCLGRAAPHKSTQHEVKFAQTLAVQAAVALNSATLLEEASNIKAAKEADRLRTELLATVSHELRTPLTAILGFASILNPAEGLPVSPKAHDDAVKEIIQNSERLNKLVGDLLVLSRLQAGALKMDMQWGDVSDMLDDRLEGLQMIAGPREIVLNVPDVLPDVKFDEVRIGQVITNLVENAAKFSPVESEIVIGVARIEGGIVIGVRDEGMGIPSEDHERIFERFVQVETGAYKAGIGTGLGLAICRSIVEEHGGSISVDSVLGEGSVFCFTLPSSTGTHEYV